MIAVFSDAHGNPSALRAVLDDIEKRRPAKRIYLGDAVTGPDPKGVMDLLAESGCVSISGNVEQWIINGDIFETPDPDNEMCRSLREKMQWTVENIGRDHVDWILSWPEDHREDGAIFVHDSPNDRIRERTLRNSGAPEGYLYHGGLLLADSPESVFVEQASLVRNRNLSKVFLGHTHASYIRVVNGVTFCNVGSAGFCLDGDPRPSWVSWDDEEIVIHHVDYDLEEAIAQVRSSEYPIADKEAYIYMLRTGNHWSTYRGGGGAGSP